MTRRFLNRIGTMTLLAAFLLGAIVAARPVGTENTNGATAGLDILPYDPAFTGGVFVAAGN